MWTHWSIDGQTYMAFFPTVDTEDDADEAAAEEFGLVILKTVMENGEELLSHARQRRGAEPGSMTCSWSRS